MENTYIPDTSLPLGFDEELDLIIAESAEPEKTFLQVLNDFVSQKKVGNNQLSALTGIDKSEISRYLNGERQVNKKHLCIGCFDHVCGETGGIGNNILHIFIADRLHQILGITFFKILLMAEQLVIFHLDIPRNIVTEMLIHKSPHYLPPSVPEVRSAVFLFSAASRSL